MGDDFELALATAQGWVGQRDVVAVGEGRADGERVIDVWVAGEPDERQFPSEVQGVRIRVQSSGGEIRALGDEAAPP